ncbi:MAG: hypothetical protein JXA07_16425 [Spirochaetes bacterium]|nr:hypothetical protein [Spirochaetota bacterium]
MNKYICALVLFLLPIKVLGIETINTRDNFNSYPVFQSAEYIEDKNGDMSFGEVRKAGGWKETAAASVNFGFTGSVYWFRFAIDNDGYSRPALFLELDYPVLDYADLYSPDGTGGYTKKSSGDLLSFSLREVKDRNILFRIGHPKGRGVYYLRVQTSSSVNFSMMLLSVDAYIENLKKELPVFWAYYGIMFVLFVYNLMILILTRDRSYFFYIFFILTWALFQFTLNGFAFQHLWPEWTWWANKCLPLFISLIVVACGMMVRTFMQTRKRYPVSDKIAIGVMIVPGIILSAAALIVPYKFGIMGATAFALIGSTTMIIMATVLVARGSRDAMFFLFSWLFMLVGIILYTLKTFGVLAPGFMTNWSIQIGSTATAILLSGALAENINVMRSKVVTLNENLAKSESIARDRAVDLEQVVTTVKGMSDKMLGVSGDLAAISDKFSRMAGDQEKTSAEMSADFNLLNNEYERLHASIINQREEGVRTRELSGGLQKSQESITRASQAVAESISLISKSNNETETTMRNLLDKMNVINEGGESIGQFMSMIDDITDRINLLSLNAAIEAARAGEHGRGFAVVADEIGKLALATSGNSKQISSQITSITRDITEGAELMSNTKKQLEQSFGIITTITNRTEEVKNLVFGQDDAVNRIVAQAGLMDELAKDIESATDRQSMTVGSALNTISLLAEMARDVSVANGRIMELTAVVKEKSSQMSNVIRQVK